MAIVKLESGARAGSSPHSLVNWNAESLAGEVVQRGADRRLDRPVESQRAVQLGFDVLDVPGIARRDDRREALERGERRVRRLAVEAVRRGLAPAFASVVGDEPHAKQAVLAGAATRDDERMGCVDGREVVLELHLPESNPARRAIDAMRYGVEPSAVERRNPMSASASSLPRA